MSKAKTNNNGFIDLIELLIGRRRKPVTVIEMFEVKPDYFIRKK